MRTLITLTILSVITFHANLSVAENEYSKLRDTLNGEREPESSFINDPNPKVKEDQTLSMQEQQKELDEYCRDNHKSAKCLEYRRLAHSRWLAEKNACNKNPLGKRCQGFRDYNFNKMMRRQNACRAGLDNRKCAMLRGATKGFSDHRRR